MWRTVASAALLAAMTAATTVLAGLVYTLGPVE